MTTNQGQPPAQTPHTELDRLVQMADAMGCQLRTQQSTPHILHGLCPFHTSPRLHTQNTLAINTVTARFECQRCGAHGNSSTFIAQCWGVTVVEANKMLELLKDQPVTAARPTPISLLPDQRASSPNFRLQNSFLLSQATDYYAQELEHSLGALGYLARLGITDQSVKAARTGFAKGWGLRQHLTAAGVTEEEIKDSPLFTHDRRNTLIERYRNVIIIPDLDNAHATRWLLAIPADTPEPGQPWPTRPPPALPLRGQRPYMFGLASTPWQPPRMTVTDDPRVILIMQQAGIPVCHTLRRREHQKIAARLIDKKPKAIALAFQDQTISDAIAADLRDMTNPPRIVRYSPSWIRTALDPATRDITAIMET